ncbi:TPA: YydF family exported signaling peptide, partial [Streptococcus agalactiae]
MQREVKPILNDMSFAKVLTKKNKL